MICPTCQEQGQNNIMSKVLSFYTSTKQKPRTPSVHRYVCSVGHKVRVEKHDVHHLIETSDSEDVDLTVE